MIGGPNMGHTHVSASRLKRPMRRSCGTLAKMKHAYFKPEWFTLNFDARAPSNVYFKPQMFTLTPVTVGGRGRGLVVPS